MMDCQCPKCLVAEKTYVIRNRRIVNDGTMRENIVKSPILSSVRLVYRRGCIGDIRCMRGRNIDAKFADNPKTVPSGIYKYIWHDSAFPSRT